MSTPGNISSVARREFLVRVRSRMFVVGTLLLVLGVAAIAFVPVIIRVVEGSAASKVAVWTGPSDLEADPVTTLSVLLNAPTGTPGVEPTGEIDVTAVSDLPAAREAADAGEYEAVLGIERSAGGDLDFTLYTNESATGRTAQLIRQACNALAIADRLDRLGIAPADQASLFAPATYSVTWPDPDRTEPPSGAVERGAAYLLGFGLTILIFMMIVLYGNWVAMSVVEEKSSRVMEVVLNAATPFQLLTGKVLGVGAVAFVQYVAILASGAAALLVQGPVADLLLGNSGGGGVELPEGLTVGLLLVLGVYGVLGFLLYAVLYAAAGSLVSRQEDVSQAIGPMALISTAGYFIGIYAATGLFDPGSTPIVVLTQVPFFTPFLIIGRIASGDIAAWEVVLSVVLMAGAVALALWLAARIYAAGVLLYGQRPGLRRVWRLMREGM